MKQSGMIKSSITEQKSEKIFVLSFLLMLGIVWTHSRIPILENVPSYFNKLLLFNEIGQDAVAPFFLITGFLFFRNFQMNGWLRKLRTRWHSLVVPFLIWNCIGAISWYLIIQQFELRYVSDNYDFDLIWEVLLNILGCRYTVLWYVGVIIVYALAAPVFYYMVRNKRIAYISITVSFIIGIAFHHPFASPIIWMSIYLLGSFLGIHYPDFLFKPQPQWLSWLGFITFPLCVWLNHEYDNMLTTNLRQWSSIFFYIGLYDMLNAIIHFVPHRIYKYSFFLYATHYLPIHVLQRYVIINVDSTLGCWVAYLVVPVFVVVTSVSIAYILDENAHRLYNLLSGGR